jgi:hypothetical protein
VEEGYRCSRCKGWTHISSALARSRILT